MSASSKVYYHAGGRTVPMDALTAQIFGVANVLVRLPKYGGETSDIIALQGSFQPYNPKSGTTHTGCAAVDTTPWNASNRIIVFDLLGHIQSHRYPWQAKWVEHNHGVTDGMGCAAASALGQVAEIKRGGDGLQGNAPDLDRHLRSGLWPLAVYQGRTGVLTPLRPTRLYDGPAYTRKVLRYGRLPGMKVKAIMEVRVGDHRWFVTDKGEWGFSDKWRLV